MQLVEQSHRSAISRLTRAPQTHTQARQLIEFLRDEERVSLGTYYQKFENLFGRDELAAFLADLVEYGMICPAGAVDFDSPHPASRPATDSFLRWLVKSAEVRRSGGGALAEAGLIFMIADLEKAAEN